MARKLKAYQTSLGFFDLAIAAPSKGGPANLGSNSNLFHQVSQNDPEVVAATMAKPGIILRRPVGSDGPFRQHADLPTHLSGDEIKDRPEKPRAKLRKQRPHKIGDEAARKAAVAFERA